MTIRKPLLSKAVVLASAQLALSGFKHRFVFVTYADPGLPAEHVCDVFPGLWQRWVRVTATLHATNA